MCSISVSLLNVALFARRRRISHQDQTDAPLSSWYVCMPRVHLVQSVSVTLFCHYPNPSLPASPPPSMSSVPVSNSASLRTPCIEGTEPWSHHSTHFMTICCMLCLCVRACVCACRCVCACVHYYMFFQLPVHSDMYSVLFVVVTYVHVYMMCVCVCVPVLCVGLCSTQLGPQGAIGL